MYYPKLDLTLPDAVMVHGDGVTLCYKPDTNSVPARAAQCWYTDDEGVAYEDVWKRMDIDEKRSMLTIPIQWVDYTLVPPLYPKPKM